MKQLRKNGCWTCLRAQEDPEGKYTCPKIEQHWKDYEEKAQLLIKVLDRLPKGTNKLVARQIIHVWKRDRCELWTDQGEHLLNHYEQQKYERERN